MSSGQTAFGRMFRQPTELAVVAISPKPLRRSELFGHTFCEKSVKTAVDLLVIESFRSSP